MANNKRWLYLAIGTVVLIFCGLIYGWSLFKAPFAEIYPQWSLSQLSMTFTVSMTSFCIGAFIAGKLSAVLKPRYIILLSAALLFVGFFGVSRLDAADAAGSLRMLYLCYGVLGGGGVGICYNNVIATLNKWFTDRPGLASGIMMMGFGLGALILGSIATGLVKSQGLFDTFFILGIMTFIALAVGSFFIRVPEERDGVVQKSGVKPTDGFKTGEMLRTPQFWIFVCWCVAANSTGLMIISSAAPIAVAFGAPAIVGMIVSIFNGAGRVMIGAIFDKLGRKRTMLINMLILTAAGTGLLLGAKTSAVVLILLGLLGMGISYGGNPTITTSFINRQFGPKYFAVNFSLANFSLIPAAIIGPLLSSKLIEKSGGTYDTTFMTILFLAAIAFVLWLLLNAACAKSEQENAR